MDTSPHKSDFVNVNGIRLHYFDWGGEGETLIFLTGMGSSAHGFDNIAPRFTDKFRVLALTRRGQCESDTPETGYDMDTLIDDILDFMDVMKVGKAILAGHSFAGVELTYFAEKYPERVAKLVYLDAGYDGKGRREVLKNSPVNDIQPPEMKTEFGSLEEYAAYVKYTRPDLAQIWNETLEETIIHDMEKNPAGKYVEKDTSSIGQQMLQGATTYSPQHANIKVPVLSFVAISNPVRPIYFSEEQKRVADDFHRSKWLPFQKREVAQFKKDIPQAKVIEIPNGHHYCFIAQENLVYEEMRKFLLD